MTVVKWVEIRFPLCRPAACDPEGGTCAAARACTRRVLVQEDPGEAPMQLLRELCRGCDDCVTACPFGAVIPGSRT